MGIFEYEDKDLLGTVESVDTSTVMIQAIDDDKLKSVQVNHLIAVQSSKVGQSLIGLVSKIFRKNSNTGNSIEEQNSINTIKVVLIGTHFDKDGEKLNVFRRTLATVPSINAECYLIQGGRLKQFMESISTLSNTKDSNFLNLGIYSIDEEAPAWINGNKFFQRHAVIVGSTGSGKSWAVATILEQVAKLPSSNAILFDIHDEYSSLIGKNFVHYKIAAPNDKVDNNNIFLPYWLLTYEEMIALMLDRSDSNAPNQAAIFSKEVIDGKMQFLEDSKYKDMQGHITLDSPIPYSLVNLLKKLKAMDEEIVTGTKGPKQGAYHGKLTRFIQRLSAKKEDKRLNFMFSSSEDLLRYEYMKELCSKLMDVSNNKGIKIINLSEVPSDILPLIVSLLARIIFSVQQWTDIDKRHPIAMFCDEAHLYIPSTLEKSVDSSSLQTFERIAKEGRKYGVGLVVISQRPSEVNRTVLSQSSNFITMRLTNIEDQSVIKRLLPDSLGDYADMLPILDIGEALIVGDACLLPSRVKISEPNLKPRSATVDFWDEWAKDSIKTDINTSVEALRKQSK